VPNEVPKIDPEGSGDNIIRTKTQKGNIVLEFIL
tara:strand:+ start:487 stop:588 length:102 start_codon:yes stop_codon:yes gene_type:complete